MVEEAVEEAHPPAELAVGDPAVGAGMVRLQMLDDAGGLDHRLAIVDQQRE